MKKTVNTVAVSGRVANLEVREFSTGKAVVRFNLAMNRTEKRGDEEIKHACFLPVEVWRNGKEAFAELKKGQLLTIEAHIRPETYTDKAGIKQNRMVFVADKFYETPDKPEEGAN